MTINFGKHYIGLTGYPAKTVTLTNTGTGPMTITDISISGDTTDFSLEQPNPCEGATIAPGQGCTVPVVFDPTMAVTSQATLTFTDNANNSPQKVLLEGTGLPGRQ
jgi:hypothetical protein